MSAQFGPWATAMNDGTSPQLSAFWQARMARLDDVKSPAGLPCRVICLLALLIGIAALFPLVRLQAEGDAAPSPVSADPESAPTAPTVTPVAAVAPEKDPSDSKQADDPTAAEIRRAIEKATQFLLSQQGKDGSWAGKETTWPVGINSLCLLALAKNGIKSDDPRIQKSLDWLRTREPTATYEVALQTLAFCAVDPKQDRERIARNVKRLEQTQVTRGEDRGSWSYGGAAVGLRADRSNAEFAVWALDEAARADVKIAPAVWALAYEHWKSSQNADGGWGYSGPQTGGSTGSMTCSGLASLAICSQRLGNEMEGDKERKKADQAVLARGVAWMAKNFATNRNPGANAWLLYYLLVLRRAGDHTGETKFGDHEWYAETSDFLVQRQHTTGTWKGVGQSENDELIGTAMALLFLYRNDSSKSR